LERSFEMTTKLSWDDFWFAFGEDKTAYPEYLGCQDLVARWAPALDLLDGRRPSRSALCPALDRARNMLSRPEPVPACYQVVMA
jgi:hypothetical protein